MLFKWKLFIWVDLGYAPAAHVLILFSVPCIVLRVEPSQKHTFFCPLSGGVIFFGGGFSVQKLHPKNWYHKSGVPPLNPIFLRSAHRAQQMEMTVRKSTFQGFRQVYIVGGARYRKPFKKNQTDFFSWNGKLCKRTRDSIVASAAVWRRWEVNIQSRKAKERNWNQKRIELNRKSTPKINKLSFSFSQVVRLDIGRSCFCSGCWYKPT